mmetsp:Transcript_28284/g.68808  ORF Transcript_28284/g.68808 Transcript_28284/m.68808 type:complete len:239 (-) Transcript_28284:138-854(-)
MEYFRNMMSSLSSNHTNTTDDMNNNSNNNTSSNPLDEAHTEVGNEVAYRLVGTPIHIRGNGGRLCAENDKIKTGFGVEPSEFIIEYVLPDNRDNGTDKQQATTARGNQRLVAFRLKDTNLYLSQNPFGNMAQAEALNSISALPILPEISQEIVDFAVGKENNETGEGEGFDYRSMQLEEGPPGLLQQFTLEGVGLRRVGIKSVYGKYWRAPQWSDAVLQSPHQMGDEDFSFSRVWDQP